MKKTLFFIFSNCLVLLTSCSRLEWGVRWADWLILREVDHYFDLSSEQDKELRKQVAADIDRIRQENFPEWAAFLREIESQVSKGSLDQEKIDSLHEKSRELFRKSMSQFQNTAIEFSLKATPEQIERLKSKFNDKTDEMLKKNSTEKKYLKNQRKRFERWTDEWLDGLTKEQDKALATFIETYRFPFEAHIQNRKVNLEKYLEARTSRESLLAYFSNLHSLRTPEYQEALSTYQTHQRNYVFDLYKSLTPHQKKNLTKNLIKRAEELESLAKK